MLVEPTLHNKHYRIKRYDQEVSGDNGLFEREKALLVHFPNKIVKFKQMKGGLYAMNPKDPENFGTISSQSHLIQTLEENLKYILPRQRARAHKARALYDAMGTPTVEDLKAMIPMNLIRNNKVTTKDVNWQSRLLVLMLETSRARQQDVDQRRYRTI
jgi:hypothetical protein